MAAVADTTKTITSNTTTTFSPSAGEHLFEIWGTWDGASVKVQHADSSIAFSGLSAITSTPTNASVLVTGGEEVELVSTGVGANTSVTARLTRVTPRFPS